MIELIHLTIAAIYLVMAGVILLWKRWLRRLEGDYSNLDEPAHNVRHSRRHGTYEVTPSGEHRNPTDNLDNE